MHAIHQRLAELWTLQKRRKLTAGEQEEMTLCLEANAQLAWDYLKLEQLSRLASAVGDHEWQHDICARIEELERKTGNRPPC
jgi:hypothetical protein